MREAIAEHKATAITVRSIERPQPDSTDADEYPEVPSEAIEIDPKDLLISAARGNDHSHQPVPDPEEEALDEFPELPDSTPFDGTLDGAVERSTEVGHIALVIFRRVRPDSPREMREERARLAAS